MSKKLCVIGLVVLDWSEVQAPTKCVESGTARVKTLLLSQTQCLGTYCITLGYLFIKKS